MKQNNNYFWMLTAVAVGILMEGCVKETGFDPDSEILFSASSSELETRTVYGAYDREQNPTKQYINWLAGDKMTIVMDYNETKSYCDYTVQSSELQPSTSTTKSVAKVKPSPNQETGQCSLTWGGTGEHKFYAMYPNGTYSGTALSGEIPAEQTAGVTMPCGYMFATDSKTVTAKYEVPTVDLVFEPAFTAFEFVLTNPGENAITLSSFKLTSSTKALNGTIAYNWSSSTPSITHKEGNGVEAEEKTITVTDIGTIASGQSATFIITTLPNDFDSADMTIICTPTEGGAKSLNLEKTVGSSTLTFGAGYKHKMTISLPTFETYTYGFDVLDPIDLTSSAASATSNTATVTSWKSSDGGTTKVPCDWSVEGYYSNEECTSAVTGSDNWITGFNPSGNGEVKAVSINYNRAASTSSAAVSDITTQLQNSTFGAGSYYDEDEPAESIAYNLSNPADMTSNDIAESANCYIVNGPGYYKIPLVMGNGVKNNADNTSAFNVAGYVSYDNTSLKNAGNVRLKNHGTVKNNSATIVWTDDGYSNAHVVGNLSNDSDWLYFSVGNDTDAPIVQSNTVIRVTNTSNVVMWSYHIWVTNHTAADDFSVTREAYSSFAAETFTIMPYYVGWKTTGGTTLKQYASSTIYVKLSQLGSGDTKVMKVYRPSYIYNESYPVGTCTFYQWGRKDPFSGTLSSQSMSGLQATIKNPDKYASGSYTSAYDVWATNYTGTTQRNTHVVKSIYDPCPAGYHVMDIYGFGYSSNLIDFETGNYQYFTDGADKTFYLPFIGYYSTSGSFTNVSNNNNLNFWTAFRSSNVGNPSYYRYKSSSNDKWNASSAQINYGYPVLPVKE